MPNFGYQFTPGLQDQFRRSLSGQAAGLPANASQALQVLSLSLPSFLGGSPPAPDALLRPGVNRGTPDLAVRGQVSGVPAGPPPVAQGPLPGPNPADQQPLTVSNPGASPWRLPNEPHVLGPSPSSIPFEPSGPDAGPAAGADQPATPSLKFDTGTPNQVTQPPSTGQSPVVADWLNQLFGPSAPPVQGVGNEFRDWLMPNGN